MFAENIIDLEHEICKSNSCKQLIKTIHNCKIVIVLIWIYVQYKLTYDLMTVEN